MTRSTAQTVQSRLLRHQDTAREEGLKTLELALLSNQHIHGHGEMPVEEFVKRSGSLQVIRRIRVGDDDENVDITQSSVFSLRERAKKTYLFHGREAAEELCGCRAHSFLNEPEDIMCRIQGFLRFFFIEIIGGFPRRQSVRISE